MWFYFIFSLFHPGFWYNRIKGMRERSGRMASFIEKRGSYNLWAFVKQPW